MGARWLWMAVFAIGIPGPACTNALPPLPPPNPRECMRSVGQSRLLLVGDKGVALGREIRERIDADTLVAIQLDGCEARVIKGCRPKHEWTYVAHQPVVRETRIRSEAELFANVALVDDDLRRHLHSAQELRVRTIVVGREDAGIDVADVHALNLFAPPADVSFAAAGKQESAQGSVAACKAATHVVTMLTEGSFAVFSEGRPNESRFDDAKPLEEKIEAEGDPQSCEASRPGDVAPPKHCGAGFAIEILPLGGQKKLEPACSGHTTWTGTQCADACGVGFKPEHCSG